MLEQKLGQRAFADHNRKWTIDVPAILRYQTTMAEYSKHQKKIIDRYYDNRDTIMIVKLQEIVTEIYLASAEGTKKRLWKRAADAMTNLKIHPTVIERILEKKKPEVLAEHLREWQTRSTKPTKRPRSS